MTQQSSLLRISNLYFALTLILLAAGVGYGVLKYQVITAGSKAIEDNTARLAALEASTKTETADFKVFASERAKKQAEFTKKIASILPPDENYTELTRQFDDFFAQNDRIGNPIFQSSLRYGKGAPVAGVQGVSALPVSMNLEATRDNFMRFLDYVNSSGLLENGIRLMDIASIQLNFPEGGEVVKDLKQNLNFTVEMNAYYQTPKIAR
ncbi:hypothetical protein HZA42_00480 [Candidatus Peregrinibacteria bacterium]|nr:hypothetical protein [Candidatus Peregrinibacteria bacterium]